jgi:hypothetical protein
MLTFDYLGEPLTSQKITPGDTATGIDYSVYTYEERLLAYTSGGTTVMKAGDTIVGATSGATAIIVSRPAFGGTDGAGSAAGNLVIKCQVGTFQAAEKLKVEADADVGTATADSTIYQSSSPFQGMQCKAAMLIGEANDMNCSVDGTLPSALAGQNVGIVIGDAQSMLLKDIAMIKNFRCIDRVSLSVGVMKVICFF